MDEHVIVQLKDTYIAKRVPVHHVCDCGHTEMIVPPCGQGVIHWACECGRKYRLEFQGKGAGAGHNLAQGV